MLEQVYSSTKYKKTIIIQILTIHLILTILLILLILLIFLILLDSLSPTASPVTTFFPRALSCPTSPTASNPLVTLCRPPCFSSLPTCPQTPPPPTTKSPTATTRSKNRKTGDISGSWIRRNIGSAGVRQRIPRLRCC